jgi:hypothetical protein
VYFCDLRMRLFQNSGQRGRLPHFRTFLGCAGLELYSLVFRRTYYGRVSGCSMTQSKHSHCISGCITVVHVCSVAFPHAVDLHFSSPARLSWQVAGVSEYCSHFLADFPPWYVPWMRLRSRPYLCTLHSGRSQSQGRKAM